MQHEFLLLWNEQHRYYNIVQETITKYNLLFLRMAGVFLQAARILFNKAATRDVSWEYTRQLHRECPTVCLIILSSNQQQRQQVLLQK